MDLRYYRIHYKFNLFVFSIFYSYSQKNKLSKKQCDAKIYVLVSEQQLAISKY